MAAALSTLVPAAAGPLAPRRAAAAGPSSAAPLRHQARPQQQQRRPAGRTTLLTVAAGGPRSEADLYQASVAVPAPAPPPPAGQQAGGIAAQPWYVTGPLALVSLFAALRIGKAVKKRMSGGGHLAERGFKRDAVADDKAYMRAIKGMKKVQYDELSEEAIAAARRRRRREVEKDMLPMDLDKIELPENHPFAVRKKLAPEEEELQRSRLSARRGLSPEDMRKLREQQALADKMDAEEEARQAAMRKQRG